MWVATLKLNWGLFAAFLSLAVTFYLLGFGDVLGVGPLVTLGGWVGPLTGLLAMDVSFAEVTDWTWGRDVLRSEGPRTTGDAAAAVASGGRPRRR